jgi:hypothetical protein
MTKPEMNKLLGNTRCRYETGSERTECEDVCRIRVAAGESSEHGSGALQLMAEALWLSTYCLA